MKKTLLLLLLLPSLAFGQAFTFFQPANGILKGSTSTFVTTPASASDVITLWSGSCSSTTFLRGDGSCQAPGGAGIGTVTSVGLAWTGSVLTVSNSPVTSSGTLTFSGALNVGTGGTGATTLTGLLKGNGTSAFSAAASSDVISLWTGTCNTTTFLRGDGSCQTIPGNTDASTLTTGTLADARLSTNVPLKNASNTFTTTQIVSGANSGDLFLIDVGASAGTMVGGMTSNSGTVAIFGCDDAITSCSNGIALTHTGATVTAVNLTGTAVNANGNPILTTTSSLNASNLSSGTVADARLSGTVANYNDSMPTFSIVGSNQLNVDNSSTGYSVVAIRTNGIQRGDLCSSTTANICDPFVAANDTALRSSGNLLIAPGGIGTASPVALFSQSSINFEGPSVTIGSSRIATVANSGRFASGRVSGAGVLSNGFNVTSVTRLSAGVYNIDLSAAGFSAPNCTATVTNSTSDGHPSIQYGVGALISVQIYNSSFSQVDYPFSFVCQGL